MPTQREYLPRAISPEVAQQIFLETRDINASERCRLVKSYADNYGCSTDTIYRACRVIDRKGKPDIQTRSDAGEPRNIDPQWVKIVWEMQWESRDPSRRNNTATAPQTIRMCEANGLIPQGVLIPSTYNRLIIQLGLRVQESRIRIEPEFVNQVHYLDASGTRYLYILKELPNDDFLLTVRPPAPNADTRKFKKIRALWYVGLVDGCSRCEYVRLFATIGEDTFVTLNFLQDAWQLHPNIPFGGIPEVLQTDNSAFARNAVIRSFFTQDTIGVKHARTDPYSKEAQGKIERRWRVYKEIEHPLLAIIRRDPGWTIKLSDYNNEFLAQVMYDRSQLPHPIYSDRTRADIWRDAMSKQALRSVPDNLSELTWWSEYRVLSAYADLRINRLRRISPDDGYFYHPDTRMARRRLLIICNLAGQVLFRDPMDPEQKTVEGRPGRRMVNPNYDANEQGEAVQLWSDGSGMGRTKTSMQEIEENPQVPDQPMVHHYQVPREGAAVASLAPHKDKPPEIGTPFTEHSRLSEEFFDRDQALSEISDILGIDLIQLQTGRFQNIWLEINSLLNDTLNRETINKQCDIWERRIHGSQSAFGAS